MFIQQLSIFRYNWLLKLHMVLNCDSQSVLRKTIEVTLPACFKLAQLNWFKLNLLLLDCMDVNILLNIPVGLPFNRREY